MTTDIPGRGGGGVFSNKYPRSVFTLIHVFICFLAVGLTLKYRTFTLWFITGVNFPGTKHC